METRTMTGMEAAGNAAMEAAGNSAAEAAGSAGMNRVCAIVPSLNPDGRFIEVVSALAERGFGQILVVNDGSRKECDGYFEQAAAYPNCTVIRHYRNLGKGRALKTAFNYCLNHFPTLDGAVTLDADNQHHIDDVVRCAQCMLEHPGSIVLGVRNFSLDNVPRRNRMGNRITIWVLNVLCGVKVSDTQTGLRAMSGDVMDLLMDLPGERFEFETNMLIETRRRSIPMEEVPIRTVYIEGNKTSHFNPLWDSVRIYVLILKFLSSSIFSSLIDLTAFTILMAALSKSGLAWKVAVATAAARVLSSLFNYSVNHRIVFKSDRRWGDTIFRYYLLAAFTMLLSMGGVYTLTLLLGIHSTLIKVVVDFILFLLGFQIQREWVFQSEKRCGK